MCNAIAASQRGSQPDYLQQAASRITWRVNNGRPYRHIAPTIRRMTYDYQATDIATPTPADIRAARLAAGHTQAQAAALVYRTDSARWREWERGAPTGRVIDMAVWELYLIKAGLRNQIKKKLQNA